MKIRKCAFFTAILYLLSALPASAEADLSKAEKYDSRDYGIITSVKDQGSDSLCWAYATAAASEASVLKKYAGTVSGISISPEQIGYARYNRGADPLLNTSGESNPGTDWRNSGGGTKYAAAVLSQWCGPVDKSVSYNANGWDNRSYTIENAISVNGKKLATDAEARQKMKRAIVKYGAVTFSYNNASERAYYNPAGENGSYPHACTVIGWDDTIPAEKFGPGKTLINGGWLIKNSYLSLPYFYQSYEVTCEQIYAFEYAENSKYDYNYFYDATAEDNGLGSLLCLKSAANVFEAKHDNEYIKAVNVGISGENVFCTARIYTDFDANKFQKGEMTPAAVKTQYLEYGGYNCVEFDVPVGVKTGTSFAVEVSISGDGYLTLSQNSGRSYAYRGGMAELAVAPRIKAFTKTEDAGYIKFDSAAQVTAAASGGEKQLILAIYEGKQLKDTYIEKMDFSKNTMHTAAVPASWKKGKDTVLKAFLWDSTGGIEAACVSAEYKFTE